MPRTEAGKRLLAMLPIIGGYQTDTQAVLIDAVEAEACHHDARWIEQFTAWCVAAERARIRAAVEGLNRYHLGTWDASSCDIALCGGGGIDRAAVLAIIDGSGTE